ncbi:hypothetical protein KSP39_PZI012987 [Platanthera zijinensis]|uniref:Uncharacterized protein n=1 Tax=Platanthera zijinensis TaxID=2320716 RepID=A0AAP0G3I1_9ASPA
MKPADDHRNGRRWRRRYFLICGAGPSIHDHEFDPSPLASPNETFPTTSFCSRLRCRSKTVPVEEITDAGRNDVGSPEIATERNRSSRFLQKLFKKKRCKVSTKLPPEKTQSKHQQPSICHVSTQNFWAQPPASLKRLREPVQTGIGSSQRSSPNAPPAARPMIAPANRKLDSAYVVLLVTGALATLLFFGRVSAVLCTCFCLSLLPRSLPSPVPTPPVMGAAEVVDVSSPEYKKKVVLMGLLERNR